MTPPWMLAAGAAVAVTAGIASGAYFNGLKWEAKYASLQAAHAENIANGYATAVRIANEANARADSVRSQPVKRVFLCPDDGAGVPGAGASADVGGVPGGGRGGDLGPALREFLAAERANRRPLSAPAQDD